MVPLVYSLAYLAAALWAQGGESFFSPSIQYMVPTKSERQIYTVSGDLMFGKNVTRNGWLVMGGGFTATGAWGEITQLEGEISNGTFRSVTYGNEAVGLGVSGLLRFEPIHLGKIRLGMETLGGVILYSNRFPAGGDIYNFMGRVGPTMGIGLGADIHLRISAHWMHVSNGQGLGPFNPSYEAIGLGVGLSRYL